MRDAIEYELLASGLSPATAAERVDLLLRRATIEILRRRDDRDNVGEISVLNLRGAGNEIVFGSCFVLADDNEQIRQSKRNRVFAEAILGHIRALTFGEFERFGRSVLRELGCSAPQVTPHAGDQGIDFYGDLSVGSLLGAEPTILRLMHETRVIIVGQAKHYPNNTIGPSTIRELVGALSLSRTYTYSRDGLDLLNDVKLRPFSPVLALIFSTGTFTKGARHLANRAGLIAFSGWQLSVFLADKGVGMVDTGGTSHFDPASFNAWLG